MKRIEKNQRATDCVYFIILSKENRFKTILNHSTLKIFYVNSMLPSAFHNAKNLGYQGKRGLQGGYGNFVPSQFNLIKNFDPDL